MINGDSNEFVARLYTCQDTVYMYKNKKYWFQGYYKDDKYFMEIFQCDSSTEGYVWAHYGATQNECVDNLMNAPIFDGNTFWQVEHEIEWVDC